MSLEKVQIPSQRPVPLFTPISHGWLFFHPQDMAGFGLAIEMQLDNAGAELTHHGLDTPLDRRIVRAVPGDEFLDDGSQAPRATAAWGG